MKALFYAAVFVVFFFLGVCVKVWQCGELFPQADTLACVLWK
ncbi:hypothetical protein ACT80S_18355 [Ramlibacter sp. MAHUQ-53]